jgi:hypothetical protein
MGEIAEAEPFLRAFLTRGLSVFVVGIVLFEGIGNGYFLEISNGQVEILNKEARQVVLFKRVDLPIVVIKHLIRNLLDR